jgi:diacylglycerol kinase family enzyme
VHAVLIENPKAGRVSPGSLRVAERALEATFELELVTTNARGHAAALAHQAVEAGAKTIIAYGGDGTVNEIVNGMIGTADSTDVVLAVLPGGTTNVLARNLGYPNDLVEATAHLIDLVEKGAAKRLKIGRITAQSEHGRLQRDFTFAAGLVLDAEIVRRVDQSKRRHRTNDGVFLYHGIRSFLRLRRTGRPELIVETPEGAEEAYWACISTTDPFTYFRTRPLRIVPGAHEGKGLHLVAGQQVRFWRTLRWLTQTLTSAKHVRHDELVHLVDQSEIRVVCEEPVPLQTDGEFLGDVTDIRAIPLPDALPVWA